MTEQISRDELGERLAMAAHRAWIDIAHPLHAQGQLLPTGRMRIAMTKAVLEVLDDIAIEAREGERFQIAGRKLEKMLRATMPLWAEPGELKAAGARVLDSTPEKGVLWRLPDGTMAWF